MTQFELEACQAHSAVVVGSANDSERARKDAAIPLPSPVWKHGVLLSARRVKPSFYPSLAAVRRQSFIELLASRRSPDAMDLRSGHAGNEKISSISALPSPPSNGPAARRPGGAHTRPPVRGSPVSPRPARQTSAHGRTERGHGAARPEWLGPKRPGSVGVLGKRAPCRAFFSQNHHK